MTVRDETAATTTVTKSVVTLFELYGSGATEVGPSVAEALGVPWVSQAFTSEAIEEAAEEARAEAETGLPHPIMTWSPRTTATYSTRPGMAGSSSAATLP